MEITTERMEGPAPGARRLEIVERKGLGHPDTICDAVAETLSRSLSRFYLDRFGAVAHHNVDKALLVGGATRPAFGGGTVDEPIEVILCGRATLRHRGVEVPLEEMAVEGTRQWFRENFHALDADRHVRVRSMIRPGSADLVALFGRGDVPLANDTSCGVGFAPLTELERAVGAVERHLNDPEIRARLPAAGEDVKVMGVRRDEWIDLTVACAFIDRFLADRAAYDRVKTEVRAAAAAAAAAETARRITVAVNTGDAAEGDEVYLTVTGTSAEAGDDGEVGRGNRCNGLITPCRRMTLEAAAGKNPVSHVGKLYNVVAHSIAAAVVDEVDAVTDAEVYLVAQIGRPVSEPSVVALRLAVAEDGPAEADRKAAEGIARATLAKLGHISEMIIDGRLGIW